MINKKIIMSDIPEKDDLLLADALLFAVYGWLPKKIKNMQLKSMEKWVEYAKKRLTWGDAYKMRSILEPKRKSLWRRILSKISG